MAAGSAGEGAGSNTELRWTLSRLACHLWAGAGAPEGVHAGGRWGPMARRRRRFFRDVFLFWRFFTCFHGNSAYLRPCYHALRQPVGAADRAMMHN